MSPLDDWRFLEGKWKRASSQADEVGEKGIVESRHFFSEELGGV